MKRSTMCLSAALLVVLAGSARAEGWGDLTATFQYDGTAPIAKPLDVAKEPMCAPHKIVDETWVVNKENGGVANVIVWLSLKTTDKKPAIHADYKATETATVQLDNNKCRFEPRVTVLRTTQTLEVLNSDPFGHNTNISTLDNAPQNPSMPAGAKLKVQPMKTEERLPVNISCGIHPWMTAKLVVKSHPYVAVSDKDGKLTIKNLPEGTWTFQVWHEGIGNVQKPSQNGKPVEWAKGKVDVKIANGKPTDLGVIKFKAK